MIDQELLERVARAAEIEHDGWVDGTRYHHGGLKVIQDGLFKIKLWNPLEDDADAFRLMVAAGLDVEWCSSGRVSAYRHANANGHCFTATESSREDRSAATRRAIVRAAAALAE